MYYFLNATTNHTAAEAINITTAILMSASNLSSIEKDAASLSSKIDSWNTVYLVFLFIALIAGATTLLAQTRSIVASRKLAKIRDEQLGYAITKAAGLEKEANEAKLKL